ncbi:hypothetical protein RvY_00159 [Ramazzottius varieornatus]|uniref:Protein kinase domain-containing protein n=1 Tax=Ramazzottius varieornatus TaxID=947166 RepID=A0A1D1UFH4_RAMVA|nr:hypothetical protein RvY_00159 [Ramazzottius varieornatus]
MAGDMLRLPMKEDELDRLRKTCDDETYKKKIVEYIMDASRVAYAFSRTASFPIAELLINCLDSDGQVRGLHLENYSIFSVKPAELQWNKGKIDAQYIELRELRTRGRANMFIMRRSVGGSDEILVKTVRLHQGELHLNGALLSMRRKALVLLDLSHPNVVRHCDFQFILDETPEYKRYMEYCAGGTL